jgi:hypothetical protein
MFAPSNKDTAMKTYQTSELQQIADNFKIDYASCGISYIGGFICEGSAKNAQAIAWFGNWIVIFEEFDGAWMPAKASNGDTGTTYSNPWTWFEKKVAKLAK